MTEDIKKTIGLDVQNVLKALAQVQAGIEKQSKAIKKSLEDWTKLSPTAKKGVAALKQWRASLSKSSEKFAELSASLKDASANLREFENRAKNIKTDNFTEALDKIKKIATNLSIATKILNEKIDALAKASEESFDRLFDDVFKGKINSARDLLRGLKGAFTEIKTHAVKSMKEAASEIANKQLFEPAKNALKELMKKQFIDPMRDELKKMGESLLNTLKDMVKNLLESLGKGPLGGLFGGLLGAAKNLFGLFGLSKGGLVKKPTLALLGEAGPELVLPLAKLGGEAGLTRLLKSASDIEAANQLGGTAISTRAGAEASGKLAAKIAAAKASSILQIAASAAQFLSGPKNLKSAANLGVNVAGAVPGLAGAAGLAAFAPMAGAFLATDVLFNKGGAIKKGLSLLGLKGFRSRATPFTKGLANLAQAGGLYLALERFRETGKAIEAVDVHFPKEAYRGNMDVDAILLKKVGATFQAVQRAAAASGVSPQEGVRRYFGEGLYSTYMGALPVEVEGDAAGRFIRRSALRLVGEAGPEHIVNVNHPQSIDFFQRGVRPIIRDAMREEAGGRGGESHTYHIHIEGNLSDDRTLEKLSRKLEEISRRRRRYGSA